MNILLIQPPLHHEVLVFGTMEPLALEVLAAGILNDHDLKSKTKVKILDMRVSGKKSLLKALKNFRPDIIGVTGITIDFPNCCKILKAVKKYDNSIVTMVGGHHATLTPQDFFLEYVDYIVQGPGVKPLNQLLKNLLAHKKNEPVMGIISKLNRGNVFQEDWISSITDRDYPQPNRDLTRKQRNKHVFDDGITWGVVSTAQGCTNRCTFCACWKATKGKYIARSPEEVVDDMAAVPERYIFFGDDHTFADIQRAEAIYELLKKRRINKIFQGYCRADTIIKHPDTIKRLTEVGLMGLTVGFESITDQGLEDMNKASSIHTNLEANKILQSLGITNYAHLLIQPSFTKQNFESIKDYVRELEIVYPVFPVFTPLPGTDLRAQTTNILTQKQQYYDLAHAVTPTTLPVEEFYACYLDLMLNTFQYSKWLKAFRKRLSNKIHGQFIYPKYQLETPALTMIPFARNWLKGNFNKKKMQPYFDEINNTK